jgi:hypothetical protein
MVTDLLGVLLVGVVIVGLAVLAFFIWRRESGDRRRPPEGR